MEYVRELGSVVEKFLEIVQEEGCEIWEEEGGAAKAYLLKVEKKCTPNEAIDMYVKLAKLWEFDVRQFLYDFLVKELYVKVRVTVGGREDCE